MSPQAGNSYDPETEQPNETIEVPSGHDTEVFAQTIRDIEQPTAAPKPGEFQRDVVDEVTPEQPRREVWRIVLDNLLFPYERWGNRLGELRSIVDTCVSTAVSTQSAELKEAKREIRKCHKQLADEIPNLSPCRCKYCEVKP